MKIRNKIRGSVENQEKVLSWYLTETKGAVYLCCKEGRNSWNILEIHNDGTVRRCGYVGKIIGLPVNSDGKIEIR